MIEENNLIGTVEGEGYDKKVQLYFNGIKTTKLFESWAYSLFHNEGDELQLNLNFGGNKWLLHAVKQLGEAMVLVPRFDDEAMHFRHDSQYILNWRVYLEQIAPQIFIFSRQNWMDVWSSLNISLEGLRGISEVTHDDIFLLWLISSNFSSSIPLDSFVPAYANHLVANILAEQPEHKPSVKDVLEMFLDGEVSLDVVSFEKVAGGSVITAYVLGQNGTVEDWSALYCSDNKKVGLLLAGLHVKLIMSGFDT